MDPGREIEKFNYGVDIDGRSMVCERRIAWVNVNGYPIVCCCGSPIRLALPCQV